MLFRNDILPAILRPGMYAGPKGNRTTEQWLADAVKEVLNYTLFNSHEGSLDNRHRDGRAP